MDVDRTGNQQSQKTWKSIVAGALDIVSSIFAGILAAATISCVVNITAYPDTQTLLIAAIPFALACLAFAGGISAIARKNWGLGLAGSIAATVAFWPAGIIALIFTVLSKNEFE